MPLILNQYLSTIYSMKLLWHFILILASFLVAFGIVQVPFFSPYIIQFLALFIVIYFVISFFRKKRNPNAQLFGNTSDIVILIISILLLISVSGNIYSPLFFLIYFLGFGITFIFEPVSVIVFAVIALLYFLPEAIKNGSIESFLRIGSILLIAPLAFFFGEDVKEKNQDEEELEKLKERDEETSETISSDVETILSEEKKVLKPKDVEKLNEILEETEDLKAENQS